MVKYSISDEQKNEMRAGPHCIEIETLLRIHEYDNDIEVELEQDNIKQNFDDEQEK
ncbi:hypothetical protein C1645_835714 [Glomus cerebriforme]|uniref:Uncharacterized protein n=1 Tax=Glomus cerebriforme TaxID=658196 RepID=A0A397SHG3_9GLOM|nr:hypothetical protein C1645_835714 [Glomus cerebriforme]